MNVKIYHGSEKIINKPVWGGGKKYNDYGTGFYCTENSELASEWAVDIHRNGFVNSYEINTSGLSVLQLEKYCTLSWLAILLENRTFDVTSPLASEAREYILSNFLPDYQKYDIITGYRADDSYFSYAQDFISGSISYRQLSNAMKLGNLGLQFVLKSKSAFEALVFTGYKSVSCEKWYEKKIRRDKAARSDYFNSEKNRRQKGDIYITTIIDEEIKEDDSRLR